MSGKAISPDAILPTRMTLQIPAETKVQFSVLDFPYAKAVKSFMARFEAIYKRQNNTDEFPFRLRPPYRQLNDTLLALAPSLIQGFEYASDGSEAVQRMVAFTRFDRNGTPEDFPTLGQLRNLIRHWLAQWGALPDVSAIVQGEGQAAWQTLMTAVSGEPETDWRHGIKPADVAANGLTYIALPALLTALLHDRSLTITSEKGVYPITWRRAHDGGKNGLHLVSQPLPYKDHYFAYRLDFSVQTQAGYVDANGEPRFWIFAHVSIQRYMTEKVHGDNEDRTVSVLVGCNSDRFAGAWEYDTTLINLGVTRAHKAWCWESGVETLLDSFSARKLFSPEDVFSAPIRHGNYAGAAQFEHDDYYIVYAEGRRFGNDRGRKHQVMTGTSLRERNQIIEGVLHLLDGWLHQSPPLQKDMQNPDNSFALRDYDYMVDHKRQDHTKQRASWRAVLETSLNGGGQSHLHLVVLYRGEFFRHWAESQITEALMGVDVGDDAIATVTYLPMPSTLYAPLDSGDLDPKIQLLPKEQKPPGFSDKWKVRMRESYHVKREEWRRFLQGIAWQPNARRLVLIDSTGEQTLGEQKIPRDQKIKGAVRDACHCEGVLSQFIVGERLALDTKPTRAGKLNGESSGKLQNAVLDLLVRQQGILYAPPHEIYAKAAGMDRTTAEQLDVIAFCRVERTTPVRLNYVLAVRLRANGEVAVLLPDNPTHWLSYDAAAHHIGCLFSEDRGRLGSPKAKSPLRLGHEQMLTFVHQVLTRQLERPTIAVIEAEGWRNRSGKDEQKQCWIQLQNRPLFEQRDILRFDYNRVYERSAPALDHLLGVMRLRMNSETPQYITAEAWSSEEPMRDLQHLTGYVDPCVADFLHYFSLAGLPETQEKQNEYAIAELFKGDLKTNSRHDMPFKHAQLIEMVPFFVHPDFDSDEGRRQLCRSIHFQRNSPGFTMGSIVQPFPMHRGEKLVEDQLCIISTDH